MLSKPSLALPDERDRDGADKEKRKTERAMQRTDRMKRKEEQDREHLEEQR